MIREFNRSHLAGLRDEIKNALMDVCKKHGINVNLGNGKFSPSEFHVKLTLSIGNSENDPVIQEKIKMALLKYNLQSDTIHREFEVRGEKYRVVRIDTKKQKYPIIATNLKTGKSFKFPIWSIKKAFEIHGA